MDMNNRLRNSERITMDVIARDLEVSKTTVSRAISGKGRIGQATRDRIMDYIASLGYKPNSMARALAGSRTYNIAVVIPDTNDHGGAPFFKDCLVGVTEVSSVHDYDTVLAVIKDGNTDSLDRLITGHRVDGFVVTRGDNDGAVVSYLKRHNAPFVLIGRDSDKTVFQIDTDQKDGCCELTARMLKYNPAGVALFAGNKDLDVEHTRYEGYAQAFLLAGRHVDEKMVFWDSERHLEKALDRLLSSEVSCVACSDDVICQKVMESLKKRKVSVPDRIKVVSFFDSETLKNNEVPVTSLHVDTKELSQKAGALLLDVLNGKKPEPVNYAKCSVIYRTSFLL